MSLPVIGISCYLEPASRGDWTDVSTVLIPHSYVAKVEAAGAVALLIPPRLDPTPQVIASVIDRLDGLIIAGGADVEASRYGAAPRARDQAPRPDRDSTELALVAAAEEAELPVLGICRGMQVMAVASGGTLVQHLPDLVGHEEHSIALATYNGHPVDTVPGSRVSAILGDRVVVPSYHHQAVASAPGWTPSAWAPDGTMEAMEVPEAPFRLAVQWHPEEGSDPRLFEALAEAAREYSSR